jgi:arylformamidase
VTQPWTRRGLLAAGLSLAAAPAWTQDAHTTIAYGPDPRQQIDLFGPFGQDSPAPILLWLPGGGWRTHARSDVWSLPTFARRNGLLLAACDYRAIPGHGARHMAQDAASAFAWIREHAEAFGGNPDRIFVMGHSAGGHLAALINCDPAYLASHRLSPADMAGVILLDGAAYDAAEQAAFLQAHGRTADFFDVLFEGDMAAFTPADRITAETPSAPMLILYASARPYAQAQVRALAAALDRAGRPYRLYPDSTANHISIAQAFGRHGDRSSRVAAAFIRTGRLNQSAFR